MRIALIGCGAIARAVHLPILTHRDDVQITVLADNDPNALSQARAAAPQARVEHDFLKAIAASDVDAAIIALPPPLHREAAVAAFERGLHVYLEKPIAATLSDGEAIVKAWKDAATVGRIGFNLRFNRSYLALRDAIAARKIGDVLSARTSFVANWPANDRWHISPSTGGGALLELASHHVDLCRFVFGAEVAMARSLLWTNSGSDQAAMVTLELSNGVGVQMQAFHGSVEEDRFEVYGTSGKLVVDRYNSLALEHVPQRASGGISTAVKRLSNELASIRYGLEKRNAPWQEPSYAPSIVDFLTAVRTGRTETSPDLADGLAALAAIDLALSNAATRVS